MRFHAQRTGAMMLAAMLLPSHLLAADAAAHWQVLPEKSVIEWTATYGGKPLKGTFPDFTSDIVFDRDHPENMKATTKIMMAKVKSEDKDAQENLPTSDWFAVSDFPLAVFEINGASHAEGDDYTGTGTLTMRGKTVQVPLNFSVTFYDDNDTSPPTQYARVMGQTTLKRLDFGIGQGDWAKTDSVADAVKVVIRLEAKQVH